MGQTIRQVIARQVLRDRIRLAGAGVVGVLILGLIAALVVPFSTGQDTAVIATLATREIGKGARGGGGTVPIAYVRFDDGRIAWIGLPHRSNCRVGQRVSLEVSRVAFGTRYRLGQRACIE